MDMKLVTPEEQSRIDNAIETAELIIEDAIADQKAIRGGGRARRPSHHGDDYDDAYAQGQKDTARVLLLSLRDREHTTSVDS